MKRKEKKRKEKKRKTTQAAKHSLHQIRKRKYIGPKGVVLITRNVKT